MANKTVGELIEFLSQFPSDMEYENPEYYDCGDFSEIDLMDAEVDEQGKLLF